MKISTMFKHAKTDPHPLTVKLLCIEDLKKEEIKSLELNDKFPERYVFVVENKDGEKALLFPEIQPGFKTYLSSCKAFRHFLNRSRKSASYLNQEDVANILFKETMITTTIKGMQIAH